MGDRELTLFELHLHGDNQFGPKVGEKLGGAESDEAGDEPELEIEAGDGSPVKGLLGLVALVLVVVLVKRVLGGGDEDLADETK